MVDGHLRAASDMIGGSASLIAPAPGYPLNGGNVAADVFLINPRDGDRVIQGFENGLDHLDVSMVSLDGYLSTAPDGSVVLEFFDQNGGGFSVTLQGVDTALIDITDYIFGP